MEKETYYIKGFEEELEKIGIAGLGKMLGIGTLAFGAGAGLGILGSKRIKQGHKATQKAVNLAKQKAGKKWSKMTSLQRSQLMSTYLGPGKGKAEYRKNLLSKIK